MKINNEPVRTPYELTPPEFVSVRFSSVFFFMFIYEPQFIADSVVDYPFSIILIMPTTIMMLMKFAEKCPKCGGFVQTKSVRKSIGLGFVEIPVAQFCLNPVCDWYQDFAETRKPEDIKEGFQLKIPSVDRKLPAFKKPEFKIPEISKNQMIALAAIIGLIVIYTIFSYFVPVNHFDNSNDVIQKQQPRQSGLQNNNTTLSSVTPTISALYLQRYLLWLFHLR